MSTSNKRSADGEAHEHGAAPKKQRAVGARTGQACDRCKVRKIRCDARAGGCSPCLQNNTECKTTDRITGRAQARGHVDHLENENVNLRMYIAELTQQLRQNNIEPGPAPATGATFETPSNPYGQQWGSLQNGFAQPRAHAERQSSIASLLPEFRAGCIGDNYLGVAPENNWLSPIEGTSLSLFGTKIDLAEFMLPEPNADAEAMSYQTFLVYAFGNAKQQVHAPAMPPYEQCKQFAEYYFRSVACFIPMLHKPHVMQLLDKIYQEGYQPSAAETVMVNTMLAIMYFQWSARNEGGEASRQACFQHYHYALTFVPQLLISHKLEDIQALAMICAQLRNQPRPAAAWMFTNMVFGVAVESGLHRSASAWPNSLDPHTIEMRKRIFWCLLQLHVGLSGRLGRPMPIRLEDFDIEIPSPVNDNLPGEASTSSWKKCSFRGGLEGFKMLRILMQVYSTIYSIKTSGGPYDVTVRQLERDLQAYEEQLPPELAGGPETVQEDRVLALYLQIALTECQLLLHHPALCRTNLPHVAATNLDACLDASNRMMQAASQLKQLKSLDTTPFYTANFLAAIFTTLFAYTEKKDSLSPADFAKLRQDMDTWLDVLGPIGQMLGTGLQLRTTISTIVDRHLAEISGTIAAHTASAAVASANGTSDDAGPGTYQPPPTANEYYNYGNYVTPAAPVPIMNGSSWDPMAWRNFAENMMSTAPASHIQQQGQAAAYANGFMSSMNQLGNGAAGVGAGMALPDSSQTWPLVQYSHLNGNA
ncbi:hypothetical protein BAUCODRAFT_101870 [Baudoinia panamericana UAMH 10762]|uniref:Zn(2)-C6 fungal-type domain-containing protein n=1 Tax=Baudoinia panamericana (strain UAMH 10762) TaxID=717646 RepID=M2MSE4_BAUPA|nr:uncharacterized protein BAUCODRAFT_101870 [Baudoinia panamericana UAMH 10762]EMC99791.1 hypothetical protein BAUCODRAFT_101870 [Baudoinia panamericana UAMH 10762]